MFMDTERGRLWEELWGYNQNKSYEILKELITIYLNFKN